MRPVMCGRRGAVAGGAGGDQGGAAGEAVRVLGPAPDELLTTVPGRAGGDVCGRAAGPAAGVAGAVGPGHDSASLYGGSDDEVIEATVMDRRWQLVLDCMGADEPPFSKGTLVGFRERLIGPDLDRRLIERKVELAAATKGFGARALRLALDSSPLWGAGRVEDTFNLLGHALRKALGMIAAAAGAEDGGRNRPWRRRRECRCWARRA